MKIGEFLQKHMDIKGINQATLARESGVPASTLSSMINRNNDRVAIEVLLKICKVLECDVEEYINSLKDEPVRQMPSLFTKKYYSLDEYGQKAVESVLDVEYERCTYTEEQHEQPTIQIEYSCLPASAGTGEWLSDENIELKEIPDSPTARKSDLAISVNGDSMEPLYRDDDVILVHKQPTVNEGEIGVFIVNGSGYVKKLGKGKLISLNDKYDDICFCENDSIICVGKVLGKV